MRSRKAAVIFGTIVAVLAAGPWFVKAQRPSISNRIDFPERQAVCPECEGAARAYARVVERIQSLRDLIAGGAPVAFDPEANEKYDALNDELHKAEDHLDECNQGCALKRRRQHVPARCPECEALARDYELALADLNTAILFHPGFAGNLAPVVEAESKAAAAWRALTACEKEKCKKPLVVGYPTAGVIGGAGILTGVLIGGDDKPPTATATAPTAPTPSATTSISTSTSTSTSTTTTTIPGITPASTFNGVWIGGGGVGTNDCSFGATATVQGTMNVDDAGRGTWTKIHTNAGVTFIFQITLQVTGPTTAEWASTATQTIGTGIYQVVDAGSISGRAMTVKQTFTRQGTPCTVIYNLTLNKQ